MLGYQLPADFLTKEGGRDGRGEGIENRFCIYDHVALQLLPLKKKDHAAIMLLLCTEGGHM